ncbi:MULTISPECIES: DUF2062 domain-containing protein [unclassified Paracoccus (in: a-proteobacteria)]|uniref:DUF2062 domain-containing protein n=1 Tax=unclassified Paracoccus (in: a-proteobacteria) TaxID=2688777 RepID=UPI0012B342F5|nr:MULTISPECIES: DUF2062 domain-containing protein [unclassified Paracoccus (in: a-proteobacteria)]UXU74541.1 DUF2062 domain-containing protein [Paracoccus sp. SMMA_5]UXU80434.1 DUF2062 domain-containing protein [Paracoccus sp. SMMA_5_TC]
MFKRRKPLSYARMWTELFYPRSGWKRASKYVLHRLRRLPDQPHRIARGWACGIFISFTPFFGFHFMGAALLAWIVRGNILAALLGTFVGNPLTLPFIALISVGLGRRMLGVEGKFTPNLIFEEFTRAGSEFWNNLLAPLSPERSAHWDQLAQFNEQIFTPYLVGGLVPGLIVSVAAHYLTVPIIRAYHRHREKQMADRIARAKARREQQSSPPSDRDGA